MDNMPLKNFAGGNYAYATMEDLNKMLKQMNEAKEIKPNQNQETANTDPKVEKDPIKKYIGKSFEARRGRVEIISAKPGAVDNTIKIQVVGRDTNDMIVYNETMDLPVQVLDMLLGK